MKFITKKDDLQRALLKVTGISVKHVSLPVLGCFLFSVNDGEVTIRATNLNVGVEVKLRSKIEEEGVFSVDASIVTSVISSIKNDEFLTCSLINNEFHIETSLRSIVIKTYPHEDFPVLPRLSSEKDSFKINSKDWIDNIKKVSYAASQSDMKPEISSLYLFSKENTLTFVCTDGYRLAEKKYRSPFTLNCPPVIIPIKSILEISRILTHCDDEIIIKIFDHMITVEDSNTYITIRIIDGVYPNYELIIPKEWSQEITCMKNDILEMLRINQNFSDSLQRLHIETNKEKSTILFYSEAQEKGKSKQEIEVKIDTKEIQQISLTVNHRYVSDVMQVIDGDSIVFGISEKKPLIITSLQDKDFVYIAMPMNK